MLSIFRVELRFPIEVAHLCRNLHWRIFNVEAFNAAHAALAALKSAPKLFAPDANGRHTAHSCDDDSAWRSQASQHNGLPISFGRANFYLLYGRPLASLASAPASRLYI